MSEKTIFKRIIDREIPADFVYEDEQCLALNDINPQAPVHVLVIPKIEIATLDDLTDEDAALMGHLFGVIRRLAKQLKLDGGYRVVINCGADGGQERHQAPEKWASGHCRAGTGVGSAALRAGADFRRTGDSGG